MKDLQNRHSLEQDCLAYFSTDEYRSNWSLQKEKCLHCSKCIIMLKT